MALVQLGVFFENPAHLGLIGAAVATAIRAVAPYVMPAVKQVGKAALMAAGDKLLSMANNKLGQMSQQAKMVKQPQPRRQVVVTKRVKVKGQKKK
jgi:predicted DNA repair protein MutK